MRTYACRLLPGAEFKEELLRVISEQKIQAGFILACVGSFSRATLRMAGAQAGKEDIKTYDEELEVVSAEGTLSQTGIHVHLGLSNTNGECRGGHLKEGCIVKTTMELVIGISDEFQFLREPDNTTGFSELKVKSI